MVTDAPHNPRFLIIQALHVGLFVFGFQCSGCRRFREKEKAISLSTLTAVGGFMGFMGAKIGLPSPSFSAFGKSNPTPKLGPCRVCVFRGDAKFGFWGLLFRFLWPFTFDV